MTCARTGCRKSARRKYCSHACANLDIAERKTRRVNGTEVAIGPDGTGVATAVCSAPTLEALVAACNINLAYWEVTKQVANVWGDPANQQWQIKAWLAPRKVLLDTKVQIEALVAAALKRIPARPRRAPKANAKGDLLVEINLTDLHMGKLAWGRETGFANYDSKIAEQRFRDAVQAIVARTAHLPVARFLLVIGSDMMHSDTKAGTTTKGTPLDNDARYHKTFARLLDMLVWTVELLRERAEVEVLPIAGNHDTLVTFHLGTALAMFYHATPDVTVDVEPTPRKYREWGSVMLMFTHGNQGKLEKYPQIMALERPEMWARTRHREAHTGDKHTEKAMRQQVQEFPGVKVRILPALCPPDAWHSELQFIGKQESGQAFVWSKSEGLVGIHYYTAQPHDPEAAEAA